MMGFAKSLSIGLMLALFGMLPDASAADKLQIATPEGVATAIFPAIAQQLGYFKALDLDVTIFGAGGGNNAVSTVVGGDAQIGVVGIRNATKPVEHGQPLKLIATDSVTFAQYIVVRADQLAKSGISDSSTLADCGAALRGLKIAVNDVGGSSGEFVRYVLAAAGLEDRAAAIININSSAARLTALKARSIDALVGSPPEPETAVIDGYGAVLVDPTKDLPELGKLASNIHIVRADYLAAHQSVIHRYLQAVNRAFELARTDPEAAKKAFYDSQREESQGNALAPEIADRAWKDIRLTFGDTLATSREQYANAQKFFKIPASVSYEKFIDNSVLDSIASGN
jgi:NitT/TauT family transport system substrate-binding protein